MARLKTLPPPMDEPQKGEKPSHIAPKKGKTPWEISPINFCNKKSEGQEKKNTSHEDSKVKMNRNPTEHSDASNEAWTREQEDYLCLSDSEEGEEEEEERPKGKTRRKGKEKERKGGEKDKRKESAPSSPRRNKKSRTNVTRTIPTPSQQLAHQDIQCTFGKVMLSEVS